MWTLQELGWRRLIELLHSGKLSLIFGHKRISASYRKPVSLCEWEIDELFTCHNIIMYIDGTGLSLHLKRGHGKREWNVTSRHELTFVLSSSSPSGRNYLWGKSGMNLLKLVSLSYLHEAVCLVPWWMMPLGSLSFVVLPGLASKEGWKYFIWDELSSLTLFSYLINFLPKSPALILLHLLLKMQSQSDLVIGSPQTQKATSVHEDEIKCRRLTPPESDLLL